MFSFRGIPALLAGSFFVLGGAAAMAQDYPNRPIRIIVANTPGTGQDTVARVMAPEMSKILGQPTIVENKPGAGTILGTEYVAKQVPPDGYTILIHIGTDLALLPLISKEMRFDPFKDLVPVIGLVDARYVLGSSATLPWSTFKEMVAQAKANPGKLNYGSNAPNNRLPMVALIDAFGMDVVFVPFSGGAPYIQALASGQVQMGLISEVTALGLGDKFRILAISGDRPVASLPGVPTFADLGSSHLRSNSYLLHVPLGTPKPVIDRLYSAASRSLQQPDAKERFAKLRFEITDERPEVVEKKLTDLGKYFAEIARKAGIKPE